MPGLMLVGTDHRAAPFDIREKLAVTGTELRGVLSRLASSTHIREVFILSTHDQTEVYLRGDSSALNEIRAFWEERAGTRLDDLAPSFYEKRDGEAVYHLFSLGAGLYSEASGEDQVLGRIKETLAAAREAGSVGGYLDALLNRTLKVSGRVRREAGPDLDPAKTGQAREILRREADRFIRWARSRRATTAITAMKQRAEDIRRAELSKMDGKLRHLSQEEREALEALTMSIVNKLIDPSAKALKEAASLGDVSDYLQAASELFDLGDP